LPVPRAPRLRATHEPAKSVAAATLEAAWTIPTRLTASLLSVESAQSVKPETAVGTEAPTPRAISRSAAASPERPPTQSSVSALVHRPIGTSVINGCRACPSHDPLRASLRAPPGIVLRTKPLIASAAPSSASTLARASAAS
jgi:hypothetical protein